MASDSGVGKILDIESILLFTGDLSSAKVGRRERWYAVWLLGQ